MLVLIPDIFEVVQEVEKKFQCKLMTIKRKKIMFEGRSEGQKIVVCTPSSKLHNNGHGWFDLSTLQVELLDQAQIAILAIRLENNKIYFIDFKDLRRHMTSKMLINYSGVDKWSLYIWIIT